MAESINKNIDLTTGVGTISFPHVFASTASKNDKGETVYDLQFIIPKSQREDVRAILMAIRDVGKAKWGDNWKKVRAPLRDGDAEAGDLTEDGSTKGDKYPERAGCYFLNARSKKPVGVYDRARNVIDQPDALYAGCKGKIAVSFYPYSTNGNNGIGVSLNGVQKISDGDSIGGGRPSVESMFDMLDDDEDLGLDDDLDAPDAKPEPAPAPAKKTAAKKTAAKKAAAKPEPVVEDLPDDDSDLLDDGDEGDDGGLYDDLD